MISSRGREPGVRSVPSGSSKTLIGSFVPGWKNLSLRSAHARIRFGGLPKVCIISESYSVSLSPGKIGMPVKSSIRMQPNDHISIAVVYGIPMMISGAR